MGSIFDDYKETKQRQKERKAYERINKTSYKIKSEVQYRGELLKERIKNIKIKRGSYSNKPSGHAKSSIGKVLRRL